MIKLSPSQISFLDYSVQGIWTVNEITGKIDVMGDVYVSHGVCELPVSFGTVTNSVYLDERALKSLKGMPDYTKSVNMVHQCLFSWDWEPIEIEEHLEVRLTSDTTHVQLDLIVPELIALKERGIKFFREKGIDELIEKYYERKLITSI